jgi:dephospho-CoA kinase
MLHVGLTGGIGSGKSTVAELFAAFGAPVVDTDHIARELVLPGTPSHTEIVAQFGRDVLDLSGQLDRKKLRARVFNDMDERRRLEAILHPRIRTEVKRQLNALDATYVIVVVPLLIETGFDGLIDRVLVVDANEASQIARVAKRSGLETAEIQKIIAAQATREQRLMHADDVIDNNGDLAALERQVAQLHQRYSTMI